MTSATKERKLTPRQEAFCLFLFKGLSQREAYLKAGYSGKQGLTTVGENACRLAGASNILARITEMRTKALSAAIMDVQERKETLTKVGRSTYADFTDVQGNLAIKDREMLRTPAIQEIKTTTTARSKETSLKLRDPIAAIQELNRMERIGTPESIINQNINVVFIIGKGYSEPATKTIEG